MMSSKGQSLGGSSNLNGLYVKLLLFEVAVVIIICRTIDSTNIEETNITNVNPFYTQSKENSQLNLTDIDLKNESNSSTTRFKRRLKSPSNLLPEFSAPIGNVTAVLGRDVRLVCTVENLGHYQVAWLKEETRTILSIDTNIIITNYRIFLIPDEEERKWVLHIKDVQESDRGFYQCQVNTNPMRSTVGYLEVVVPPKIIESQTTQVAEIAEHSNVSIQCKANGHPRPSVVWRREDGLPIRLNGRFGGAVANLTRDSPEEQSGPANMPIIAQHPGTDPNAPATINTPLVNEIKSDKLTLLNVDRSMAGLYVCNAFNGIPTQVSKRIPLYVKFPPKITVKSKYISVSLGEQLEIDCFIEAFPKPTNYWSRKPAPRSDLSPSRNNNDGSFINNSNNDNKLSNERVSQRVPKRKQMAIYEQVTTQQPQIIDNGYITVQPDSKLVMTGRSLSGGGDKLIDGDIAGEFVASLASNRNLPRQQYSSDKEHKDNTQHRKQHIDYPSNEIVRHDFQRRLKLKRRQVVMPVFNSDLDPSGRRIVPSPSDLDDSMSSNHSSSSTSPVDSNITSAYITVKQTAINSYTYKLRLTIDRVQAEDFGGYICISSNPLGTSQEYTFVTRADRSTNVEKSTEPSGEIDYQRDSLLDNSLRQQQQSYSQNQGQSSIPLRNRHATSGNGRVYDKNYLQDIKKSRNQNGNFAATGKLQQKLRMRPERSGSSSSKQWMLSKSMNLINWVQIFAVSIVTVIHIR